jgi:translation elongation factor P/translation initiation factor 5A
MVYRSDKKPKKIKIRNQVLTGLYSDQTNMIFININKFEEAMRLTPEHDKETYSMK